MQYSPRRLNRRRLDHRAPSSEERCRRRRHRQPSDAQRETVGNLRSLCRGNSLSHTYSFVIYSFLTTSTICTNALASCGLFTLYRFPPLNTPQPHATYSSIHTLFYTDYAPTNAHTLHTHAPPHTLHPPRVRAHCSPHPSAADPPATTAAAGAAVCGVGRGGGFLVRGLLGVGILYLRRG